MTNPQRARIAQLRKLGYKESLIAEMVGVTPGEVHGTRKGIGRPRGGVPPEQAIYMRLLNDALARDPPERAAAVRSVIGNFGPELGLTLQDATRLACE